jgi:predicted Rossmann fold nucleotide-binding protein DprA/Smf involved in DNA uptake
MAEISPPRHTRLAAQIVDQSGGYFTEQPFHRAPTAGLFPVRNRLIAGASLATVVVEAARKSGALITANMAHKYHRSVFAVPGAWFMPYSQGPNALIEEQLAEAVVDLDRFPGRFYPPWAKNNELFDLSGGIEEALIKLLPHGRIVNSLQFRERLGVPNNMIFSGLRTLLELGLVERIGPDTYRRKMD